MQFMTSISNITNKISWYIDGKRVTADKYELEQFKCSHAGMVYIQR